MCWYIGFSGYVKKKHIWENNKPIICIYGHLLTPKAFMVHSFMYRGSSRWTRLFALYTTYVIMPVRRDPLPRMICGAKSTNTPCSYDSKIYILGRMWANKYCGVKIRVNRRVCAQCARKRACEETSKSMAKLCVCASKRLANTLHV